MHQDTALLIVDVQNGMFMESDPVHDGQGLVERVRELIRKARACDTPVIYVQHNEGEGEPLASHTPGWEIHPLIAPVEGDIVIQKHVPDAFRETNLQAELDKLGIANVVVAGLQTDMCIEATSRRASELGYRTTVAGDCHSTWAQGGQSAERIIASRNELFRSFADVRESAAIDFCPA
ncbi:cysteine hydrolase family protein [Paenibacillus glycinis]|uniref:Isochorismatase family protein n=1 Tax=Paenibacillus glycinis TaxID=2697035 RepID=A0ABW9XYJ1_9BACL|nr:cysteine hydrolase family protein [Paenibacillus glycinis]NBD27785.1 isochorismatase family protein [Paenibacillus glycinis]